MHGGALGFLFRWDGGCAEGGRFALLDGWEGGRGRFAFLARWDGWSGGDGRLGGWRWRVIRGRGWVCVGRGLWFGIVADTSGRRPLPGDCCGWGDVGGMRRANHVVGGNESPCVCL